MKHFLKIIIAALLLCSIRLQPAAAQITIGQCLEMAKANYPQVRQLGLIEEAARYDIASISKSWLPKFTVSGKANYQSDVVEMPFDIPGFTFEGTLEAESETTMLLIPYSAVERGWGGSRSVTVLEDDGSTRRVDVRIEYLGEGLAEVLEGDIKPGDKIWVHPGQENPR